MEKLSDMAMFTICFSVLQVSIVSELPAMGEQVKKLMKYFQALPEHMCDEILSVLIEHDFSDEGGGDLVPGAEHIAPFVRDNIKKLSLDFDGDEFVFEDLLYFSGSKLKNLEELKLPDEYHLDQQVCRQMCILMPNLRKLDLNGCQLDQDAMPFIANLPLIEFDPGHSITERAVEQLCQTDSLARQTLRVFRIGDYGLPTACYHKLLSSMKLLEDLDSEDSKWFINLPHALQHRQFNLRKLNFDSSLDMVEEELEIVLSTCPKLTNIKITSHVFTPRIMCTLTMFEHLANLNINVVSNGDQRVEDKNQLCERICLDNASFPVLSKLTLSDSRDAWISNGYLFRILEMCPHLDTLKLWRCDGFSNKIATELAGLMAKRRLKHLFIEFCNLLGPNGVDDLLKIPSLIELKVLLFTTDVVKQHFDSHPLHDDANKYSVDLKLIVFVDFLGLFH
uniref:F-box domain-containing protein n=1 Tax=Strigamia maritima TaxID=126957 RepID=T1J313_STRMM